MPGNRTIPRLWREALARNTGTAYLVDGGDSWSEVSWAEAGERVELIANGLLARGVGKGDAYGILARTTLEWALLDFALGHIGAIGVGIYANSSPKDVAYVLEHAEALGVICEDDAQRAKVEERRAELPALREVLTFADLAALEADGREHRAANPGALDDAVAAIDEEDIFTLIYTSGTTGPPKGCMIRHRNYYAMVSVNDELPDHGSAERRPAPLPSARPQLRPARPPLGAVRRVHDGVPARAARGRARDAAGAADDPPERPARLREGAHRGHVDVRRGDRSPPPADRLVARRRPPGEPRSGNRGSRCREGSPHSVAIADRLVFSKVKERLGGRLRIPISGGAPLAKEVAEFFDAMGIRIREGYGLTECTTAAATNTSERTRFGTVGPALPGFELRIAEDGELMIRSETVFAGYFKDPEATAAVLEPDGWLHSGDIATIDEDGFVTITDRKKDIIVTAGGKNIAPQNLENDLKTSRFVSQALVVGDRRPYPAALITLDPAEIGKWAAEQGLQGDVATLARDPKVVELVSGIVEDVNRDRSRFEQLKRFAILPRDFEMEQGEVTPTLKLKRRVVLEHFSDEVEGLYSSAGSESAGADPDRGDPAPAARAHP